MRLVEENNMADFKNKVVYQIYPKSFKDSNGDGIGDLRGVMDALDYLADMGVDYLWLTPFFVSPQKDNGYDIADYLAIDPHFGTMDDFDALVKAADAKGLKIMLDMVLCHTSDQHAWFQRALAGDADYQRYYILRDGRNKKSADDPGEPPTNWQCAFGGSAWQWEPRLGKWYLHLHDVSQPDLDWTNPTVRDELAKVVRFWKERGVAGFRFDVINLVAKPEVFADDTRGLGRRLFADGPHIHEYLQELVHSADIGDMVTIGEMASTDHYRDVESLNYYRILREQGKTVAEALTILAARSRDNGRTPMQWSAGPYTGFSTKEPWIPLAKNHAAIHVEAAQRDEDSILAFYRRLIRLRHEMPIIAEGDIRCIEEDNPDVIAYERTWQGEQLTVLCNFRPTAVPLRHLSLQDFADARKLLGNYPGREECLRPYEVLALYRRA